MTQTAQEMFDDLQKIVEEYRERPPTPVGLVFRAALRIQIETLFQTRMPASIIPEIPVFWDADQQEDCIEFFDHRLLTLYLNRRSDPQSWGQALAELFPPNRSPFQFTHKRI